MSHRILLVTPSLHEFGGIQELSIVVRKSLIDSGLQVSLVSLPSSSSLPLIRLLLLILFYFRILSLSLWSTCILSMHPSLLQYVGFTIFKLRPALCWVHGIDVWGALPLRVIQQLRCYHRLIGSSHFTIEKMHLIYSFLRQVPSLVINPSVVSSPSYSDVTVSSMSHLHLLSVSRLSSSHRYKGHDQVIDALSLLDSSDWSWTVVGSGDDLPRLKHLACTSNLSDKIHFLGDVPRSKLTSLYQHASVFVLPSYFSNGGSNSVTGEGFGIVYLEAALACTPSIASLQGGHCDLIVDGSTGWLIDQEPTSLVSVLQSIIDNPSLPSVRGFNARERAIKYFSLSTFSERLKKALPTL